MLRHANGGFLERLTNTPQYAASTLCGWFMRKVDRNADSCLMLVRGDLTTGLYTGIYTGATNDVLRLDGSFGTSSSLPTAFTNDVPYFVALVGNGASLVLYGGTTTANLSLVSVIPSQDPLIDMVRIGDDGFGAWLDGNSAGLIQYSRVLSTTEIARQMVQSTPISRVGLVGWWPEMSTSVAGDLIDISGNGNNWTQVGTPTFAAEPLLVRSWRSLTR